MAVRKLKLRQPDVCVACSSELNTGEEAWWDPTRRAVTCLACWRPASVPPPSAEVDRERAGASLAREYDRRRRNREERTRQAHPHIGGLLLLFRDAPQHEAAFHLGDLGERAVAASLERRLAESPAVVLHNRRMPKGKGDIDHIVVAPSGVYVIDTKNWQGKVQLVTPWFGSPKLLIDGRDRTNLIDGLERQIAVVRGALDQDGHGGVPIQGALCFTRADLPLLRTQKLRGHLLLYRKALAKRVLADGPLAPAEIQRLARMLSEALPPA